MRLATALAAFALSCFPATKALADTFTFTFTPNGGSAYTVSTTGLSADFLNSSPFDFIDYSTSTPAGVKKVYFYGADMASALGYGSLDFDFEVPGLGSYYEDGPQLFAGVASSTPSFFAGTYHLVGDPIGNGIGGTLVITNDTPVTAPTVTAAVTPEPSSVALLGTGLLGFAGLLRRRMASGARA